MTNEQKSSRHRWPARAWIRWPVFGFLALSALAAVGFATLQSRTGQEWAGGVVGRILGDTAFGSVRIIRVELAGWRRIRLHDLSIADRHGRWFSAPQINIDWRPLVLLDGAFPVEAVGVPRIDVLRRPVEQPVSSSAGGPLLPRLPRGLRAISVDEIQIHEPVIGISATFRARYRGPAGNGGDEGASIGVERLDRAGDRVEFLLRTDPNDGRIALRMKGREAPGGVIARFLRLPSVSPLTLDLDGDGNAGDWNGRLHARSGDSILADSEIGIRVHSQTDISITAKGQVGVATLSALQVPAALRSPVAFDADLRWREKKNEIGVARLNLEHAVGRLSTSGRVIADEALIDADVSGTLQGADWLASLLGPDFGFGMARFEGKITGPAMAPALQVRATLTGVSAPGVSARTARIVVSLDGAPGAETGRLKADLKIDGVAYDSPAAAVLGDAVVLTANARTNRNLSRWTAIDVQMRSGKVRIDVSDGSVDVIGRAARLTLETTISDLVGVGRASGFPLSGAARSRASISVERGEISAKVTVGGNGLGFGDPHLNRLIGPRPTFGATISGSPNQAIAVRDVRADAAAFSAEGKGELDLAGDRITAEFAVKTADLMPLTSPLGLAVGGKATVTGTAEGSLSDPGITVALRVPAPNYQRRPLGPLDVDATVRTLRSRPSGEISAQFDAPGGRVDGSLQFFMAHRGEIRLHDIALRGLGGKLTGLLDVPLDGGVIVGKLTGELPDLAALSPLTDLRPRGGVLAEASLRSTAGVQSVMLQLTGTGLAAGDEIGAASTLCTGELRVPAADLHIDATCVVENARFSDLRATHATVSASGTPSHATVRVGVDGDTPLTYRLEAAGEIEQRDSRLTVRLNKFVGDIGGQPVGLGAPARIELDPQAFELTRLQVRIGRTELDASAKIAGGTVLGELRVNDFELSEFVAVHGRANLSGRIDGTISLRGASANPKAEFGAQVSRLSFSAGAGPNPPVLEGRVGGEIADGEFSVDAALTGFGETGLRGHGKVPVQFTLSPVALRVSEDAPIRADVRWSGDLAPLVELFPIPGHAFSGQASVSIDARGTVRRPITSGSLRIREARYENLFTGTVITGLEFDGEAAGEQLRLRIAGGGDGGVGRLEGSGTIALDHHRNYPIDLTVSITELAAVRRDDVSAVIDGRMSLVGNSADLVLRGDIETRRVEWQIGQPLPPGVVDVQVTEIGEFPPEQTPRRRRSESPGSKFSLDLDIRMPGNVYVRGRGLDSEWRGAAKITGSTKAPSVLGKLENVRGQFEFAGKAFKLMNGVVTFPPSREIDPQVSLRAEHKAKSLTAIVTVEGKASMPSIKLSSVPSMPRDEILSRVLFSKGVGQLSQLEAAQLGLAVASVTGLDGGGPGLIDTLRRSTGVDVLRVGSNSKGAPTAVVGKNISDEMYVGVEQGGAANSGKVQVELEVLPGIKLKSGVNAESQGNIGVELRWDY